MRLLIEIMSSSGFPASPPPDQAKQLDGAVHRATAVRDSLAQLGQERSRMPLAVIFTDQRMILLLFKASRIS